MSRTIDKTKLKGLQSQISKLKSDIDLDRAQLSTIQKGINSKLARVKELEKEFKKLGQNNELIVSEHAILRYLERVKELDLEEVTNSILNEKAMELYEKLGNSSGKYPADGFNLVIKDNVVITIEV